ncbi:MAG: CIA30 family protein [Cytophagales bacterium]|nr:CIA30 family protein [Cytophagales bacterium]
MFHLILSFLVVYSATFKIDFNESELKGWYIINDGVMGGLSKGQAQFTDEGLLFYGSMSLENNGGFTSLRSPFSDYNLSEYKQITIRYRSKGISMALQMEEDRRFYYPNFKVKLPKSEAWVTKTYVLSEVRQYRMGYATGNLLQRQDQSEIIRMGFITDEKKAGDFEFEVAYVEFR